MLPYFLLEHLWLCQLCCDDVDDPANSACV